MARSSLCVVHLVRAANGPAPWRRFADAWRRNPPGCDCDLVLALKGFASDAQARQQVEDGEDLLAGTISFDDSGRDLDVYFAAAKRLDYDRFCFVNSFSEPLVGGWLAQLDSALLSSGVGMVGATGSWASSRSMTLQNLYLPSAYAKVIPDRREAKNEFLKLADESRLRTSAPATVVTPADSQWQVVRKRLRAVPQLVEGIRSFPSFPAPHLRTNTFAVERATLDRLKLTFAQGRLRAHRLESGHQSVTRQMRALGLRTLVVDRDGASYDEDQWDRARTFWQGDQEGLLVADNQTRDYRDGDALRRTTLSRFAWGSRADPTLPLATEGDRP